MKEVVHKKTVLPIPTRFEKTMSYIAPGFASNVYKTRCALAMVDSYKGASKSRRNMVNYDVKAGDFDSDVLPELPALRERSEDLYRNNMLASGAINTKVTSIVGRGLTAQSRIDASFLGLSEDAAGDWEAAADRWWSLWSESKNCTINKKHNFRELQHISLLSTLIRGDCFNLTPEKKEIAEYPFKLRMQLVEADRVTNKDNAQDTSALSGGIETDAYGAPKRLHVLKGHPGNYNTVQNEWDTVPFFGAKTGRRNVLHLYSSIRGDQSRGVPDLAPVIEGLKQFATLTQATVDAAVIQTFLSVLIETPDGNGLDLDPGTTSTDSNPAVKLESGAIIDLAEGEKAHTIDPTHPNSNYPGFAAEFYTQVGTALNLPHELLVKHFQSSYSAAQAALKEAWRFFMVRRSWLVDNLCQPAHDLFIAEMVSTGKLSAPGFFTDPIIRAAYCGCDWVGPPMGHIRDDVQNKADGMAEDRGWKTSAQNTQERGGVWSRNVRQRKKEIQEKIDAGIIIPPEEKGNDMVPIE